MGRPWTISWWAVFLREKFGIQYILQLAYWIWLRGTTKRWKIGASGLRWHTKTSELPGPFAFLDCGSYGSTVPLSCLMELRLPQPMSSSESTLKVGLGDRPVFSREASTGSLRCYQGGPGASPVWNTGRVDAVVGWPRLCWAKHCKMRTWDSLLLFFNKWYAHSCIFQEKN